MHHERVQEYFDSRAESYMARSRRGLWDRFRRREFEAVVRLLAPSEGLSVLDAGAGAGYYALRLRDEFGVNVMGVDLSAKMVNQLTRMGVQAWHGDFANFQGEEKYDRVLIAGMLEFSAHPEGVFAAAHRALKQSGRLVVLIPQTGFSGWAYAMAHVMKGCPTRILPEREYRRLASHFGFEFIESSYCTPISLALSWVK